jgi:hypothetical protein
MNAKKETLKELNCLIASLKHAMKEARGCWQMDVQEGLKQSFWRSEYRDRKADYESAVRLLKLLRNETHAG